MDKSKLTAVAFHEAGHAVAAVVQGALDVSICLEPITSARSGHSLSAYCDTCFRLTSGEDFNRNWKRLVTTYAGCVAEAKLLDESPVSVYERQTDDQEFIHSFIGEVTKRMTDGEFLQWRRDAWEEAQRVVEKNWDCVTAVAQAALADRFLDHSRIVSIVRR